MLSCTFPPNPLSHSRDISKLWSLAQRLVQAMPDQLKTTMGPDYALIDEFPDEPGEVGASDGVVACAPPLRKGPSPSYIGN